MTTQFNKNIQLILSTLTKLGEEENRKKITERK